jgi:hypothetical protein
MSENKVIMGVFVAKINEVTAKRSVIRTKFWENRWEVKENITRRCSETIS